MAIASVPVDVIGNTAQLRKQIEQISKTPLILDVKTNNRGVAPLGRISGDIAEIDKSLAAANARVVAFGASAGAIYGLQRAVEELFRSFVETEKRLTDINVVLNLSNKGIANFGDRLFDIAANTAQSFDTVATAATEFARQGLGVEETLKRTSDALILTRLSGLDAAASVEALTAAINSFNTQALSTTEIVNKLANVDAAFAVSSADLAEALSRVGSSASDAGISFDELIALVTTAQQVTARGGSVIGNSLKTIFTRLGRQDTLDLLGGLGIETTNAEGRIKNQIELLRELADTYTTLNQVQQNEVAEKVGGVFQINILKAALGDLGKEYSIYDRALRTSINTTNEAIQRNSELNQTLSALGSQTLANVQKAASKLGEGLLGPASRNILNIVNSIAKAADSVDSNSIGAKVGKGIIDGIGQFLGGPGIAILAAVLTKLGLSFSKYLAEAGKSLLGTNQAAKNQAAIQQAITGFLTKNSSLYQSILKGQTSTSQAAQIFLKQIQAQTSELQRQVAVANAVAAAVSKAANASRSAAAAGAAAAASAGRGGGRRAAMGFIPNFSAAADAYTARTKGGYQPGEPRQTKIKGEGVINWNSAESLVQYPGAKTAAIVPPENSRAGKLYRKNFKDKAGFDPYSSIAANGFVPNFAPAIEAETSVKNLQSIIANKSGKKSPTEVAAAQQRLNELKKKKQPAKAKKALNVGGTSFGYFYASEGMPETVSGTAYLSDNTPINYSFPAAGMNKPFDFKDSVNRHMTPGFQKIANEIYPRKTLPRGNMMQYFDKSSTNQSLGRLFEAAVQRAIRPNVNLSGSSGGTRFDIPKITGADNKALSKIFAGGAAGLVAAELKYSRPGGASDGNVRSMISKLLAKQEGISVSKGGIFSSRRSKKSKTAASGFIPNFAAQAISEAVSREKAAGASSSQIRLDTSNKLKSKSNPEGMGIWSTQFESSLSEGISIAKSAGINPKTKGAATGFIPNFENGNDFTSDAVANAINLSIAGSFLIPLRKELKDSLDEELQIRKEAIKKQRIVDADKDFENRREKATTKKEIKALEAQRQALLKSIEKEPIDYKLKPMEKARAGLKAPGMAGALAFGVPIVTSTLANTAESAGANTLSKAISGFGDVVSMAATGAYIGRLAGGPGAVIGGVLGGGVGLWQALSSTVKEATDNLPQLAAAAEAAATGFQQFRDTANTSSTALQRYNDIVASGAPEQERRKAFGEYQKTLQSFDPEDLLQVQKLQKAGKTFFEALEILDRQKEPEVLKKAALSEIGQAVPAIQSQLKPGAGLPDEEMLKSFRNSLSKAMFGNLEPKEILNRINTAIPKGDINKAFDPRIVEQTLSKLIPGTDETSIKLRESVLAALKDERIGGLVQEVLKEAVSINGEASRMTKAQLETVQAIDNLDKNIFGNAKDIIKNQKPVEAEERVKDLEQLMDWNPTRLGFDPTMETGDRYKKGGYRLFTPEDSSEEVAAAKAAIARTRERKAFGYAPLEEDIQNIFRGALYKELQLQESISGDVTQAPMIAAGRVKQYLGLTENEALPGMPETELGNILHTRQSQLQELLKKNPNDKRVIQAFEDADKAYKAWLKKNAPPKGPETAGERALRLAREADQQSQELDKKTRRKILENSLKLTGKAPPTFEALDEDENVKKAKKALEDYKKESKYGTGTATTNILGVRDTTDPAKLKELEDAVNQAYLDAFNAEPVADAVSGVCDSINSMADCVSSYCPTPGGADSGAAPQAVADNSTAKLESAAEKMSSAATSSESAATSMSSAATSSNSAAASSLTSADRILSAASLSNQAASSISLSAQEQAIASDLFGQKVDGFASYSDTVGEEFRIAAENAFAGLPSALAEGNTDLLSSINGISNTANGILQASSVNANNAADLFGPLASLNENIKRVGPVSSYLGELTPNLDKISGGIGDSLSFLENLSSMDNILNEAQSLDESSRSLDDNVKDGNQTRDDVLSSTEAIETTIKGMSKSSLFKGCLEICDDKKKREDLDPRAGLINPFNPSTVDLDPSQFAKYGEKALDAYLNALQNRARQLAGAEKMGYNPGYMQLGRDNKDIVFDGFTGRTSAFQNGAFVAEGPRVPVPEPRFQIDLPSWFGRLPDGVKSALQNPDMPGPTRLGDVMLPAGPPVLPPGIQPPYGLGQNQGTTMQGSGSGYMQRSSVPQGQQQQQPVYLPPAYKWTPGGQPGVMPATPSPTPAPGGASAQGASTINATAATVNTQSATINGASGPDTSNLSASQQALQLSFQDAASSANLFSTNISSSSSTISSSLNTLGSSLTSLSQIGEGISTIFNNLSSTVPAVSDSLNLLSNSISPISDGMNMLGASIPEVANGMSFFSSALPPVTDGMSLLGAVIPEAANGMSVLSSAIIPASDGMAVLGSSMPPVVDGMALLGSVTPVVADGMIVLGSAAPEAANGISRLAEAAYPAADGFAQMSNTAPILSQNFAALSQETLTVRQEFSTIDFERFNNGISSITVSAERLSQTLLAPIKIDLTGRIDAPTITNNITIDTSALQASIQRMTQQLSSQISTWVRSVERELLSLNNRVNNLQQRVGAGGRLG